MRINFSKIEIHNFMSFADEVFDYSEFKGMNLICGKNNDIPGAKNGTGKSTLFSALVYCLFGDLQNSVKNENIHNRYVNSKEVRVVTYFSIEDDKYKVASGFNKYGAPYCQVSKIEDGNELDLTKSSMAETRKFLEKEILHCDMSIFLRTVMLSSDQTYNFFKLRKGEKKEFIEKLFDISIFGDMYNTIHRDILNYDKDMLALQSKLMLLNKNNDAYQSKIKQYDEQKQTKLEQLKNNLDQLLSKYKNLKNKKIAVNDEEVNKYEALSSKIDEGINKIGILIRKIEKDINDTDVSLHKAKNLKDQKQKVIDKYTEILAKLCDDCSKVFKDYYNITNTSEEIKQLEDKCSQYELQLNEKKEKKSELNSKLDTLNKKLNIVSKKIEDLTLENTQTKRELSTLSQRIDWTRSDIEREENEENPYNELLENNQKNVNEENENLEKMSDEYKYLKFAESIVAQDTLRKFIIKDLVGLLNNKLKQYLTKLGADYTVVFDADMDYQFITDGGTCEYNNFSAGERQRIMLATCFAFRDFMAVRNNLTSNILILDEFIDGNVDAVAIEGVIQVLRDFIIMYNQNIYVVSHRKEIDNSIFNNIIQVQRTNHISKVVVLDV